MDYRRIYQQLCERGQTRQKQEGIFYEKHHIKPRSFGGRKTKENLTVLTLREHYIAHLLLVAIYPSSTGMQTALWNMCNVTPKNNIGYERYKPSARTFERIRSEYTKNCSGKNAPMYGKHHTPESKKKLSDAKIGKVYRIEYSHTEETKEKIRQKRKGHKASEYSLMKNRQANRGGKCYKAKTIVCTRTGEIFGSGRELSESTQIPFGTIRRWLNGSNEPPEWFHYRREEDIGKEIVYKVKRNNQYSKPESRKR
jgi:NUMOD3 motif